MGWMDIADAEGNVIGVAGDEAWDIMGEAFAQIISLYRQVVGYDPTDVELDQIVSFTRPHKEEI